MNLTELKKKSAADLITIAQELKLEGMARSRKQDVIFAILKALAKSGEDIKAVRKSIEALQAAPGQRWEKVVEKIILVAVGAVVAWLLARMGIK